MGQTKGKPTQGGSGDERLLARLKLDLVAAYERGERDALGALLRAQQREIAALTEFRAALAATSGYERETPTPETRAIAERARDRALAAAFPAAPAALAAGAPEAGSLKALRRARGLGLAAVARHLGLGLDVLADLEAGLIRAASAPERLTRALGELLQTTSEEVRAALGAQPMLRPALQRDRGSGGEAPVRDFDEAVRLSPSMSAEQKAGWLEAAPPEGTR
jgi:hypothetical protein